MSERNCGTVIKVCEGGHEEPCFYTCDMWHLPSTVVLILSTNAASFRCQAKSADCKIMQPSFAWELIHSTLSCNSEWTIAPNYFYVKYLIGTKDISPIYYSIKPEVLTISGLGPTWIGNILQKQNVIFWCYDALCDLFVCYITWNLLMVKTLPATCEIKA